MPTSESFKDFVLENLNSALEDTAYRFSAKKMFGEYCIYVIVGESVPKPISCFVMRCFLSRSLRF